MLLVFGAAVPVGMFAPRYAALVWAVIMVVGRFTRQLARNGRRPRPGGGAASPCWRATGQVATSPAPR